MRATFKGFPAAEVGAAAASEAAVHDLRPKFAAAAAALWIHRRRRPPRVMGFFTRRSATKIWKMKREGNHVLARLDVW